MPYLIFSWISALILNVIFAHPLRTSFNKQIVEKSVSWKEYFLRQTFSRFRETRIFFAETSIFFATNFQSVHRNKLYCHSLADLISVTNQRLCMNFDWNHLFIGFNKLEIIIIFQIFGEILHFWIMDLWIFGCCIGFLAISLNEKSYRRSMWVKMTGCVFKKNGFV